MKRIVILSLSLCLAGCQPPFFDSPLKDQGCRSCHPVSIDTAHDIGCDACHGGHPDSGLKESAHRGLRAMPAHPDFMDGSCGGCHKEEVSAARRSVHFTLRGEVGLVWNAFFPGDESPSLRGLPVEEPPRTARGIVGDALRRRCLRCHVYYRGEAYRGTTRGSGCAACHMKPGYDHFFRRKVSDERCISCHYGNFVGWDYYGRFEKDYEEDFRAPLQEGEHLSRPFGLEWLEMTPDVHEKAGMTCGDCHVNGPCQGLSGKAQGRNAGVLQPKCLDCHLSGKREAFSGPLMSPTRPGHAPGDRDRVSCAACHAVWGFVDAGRSLLRQDAPDYEEWLSLAVQGSSEIESQIRENAERPEDLWSLPVMVDKISGDLRAGMWFGGFTHRRKGPVRLAVDANGRLQVVRPLLDLSISYVDGSGDVVFDNLRPKEMEPVFGIDQNGVFSRALRGWIPYVPHTIGSADAFRSAIVGKWLAFGQQAAMER